MILKDPLIFSPAKQGFKENFLISINIPRGKYEGGGKK